jgi:cyclophilin family peptidyl-prolyl cis-trans isomerase
MFGVCRLGFVLGFYAGSIVFAAQAHSQEPAPQAADATPKTPPEKTPSSLQRNDKALVVYGGATISPEQAKATFKQKFDEYNAAVSEIEKLQVEFQSADAATREKLNATMAGQVAHAQSLMNELVEAATAVYRLAPNADPQVADLLLAVARYYTIGQQVGHGQPNTNGNSNDEYIPIDGGDQYERALPVVTMLIDGGNEDKELLAWGFLSAFMTNDYELASKYLDKLQANGGIQAVTEAASKSDKNNSQAGLRQNVEQLLTASIQNLDQYRDLWAQESAIRAAEAKADDLPRVKLTTSKGEIVIELFENQAPGTVANFLTLVKDGFYDGSPFHRVLPGFMAQGGAKTDDGAGGPGYKIRCECYKPDYRRHFRGTLSMAHAGRDTGSSQFFLTFVPTAHLNGRHTAFGRVIEGMEVMGDLQRRSTQHETVPPKADRILKAEVIRDRGHEYKFERLPE